MWNTDRTSAMPAGMIPRAYGIDYSDVDEVCGYQLLLCKMFERAGGFSYPLVTNSKIREITSEGEVWLREVRDLMTSLLEAPESPAAQSTACDRRCMTLNAVPRLLSSYDLLYRVCNGEPCRGYLREVRIKTADRWLRGDKSISTTDVVLLLLKEMAYNVRTLEKRYSDYGISMLGTWIDELSRHGRFRDIPLHEAYSRLTYLIQDDLFAYLGGKAQDKIKRQWVDAYRLDRLSTLDTPILWKYIGFIRTAAGKGINPSADGDEQYMRLFSELASRPDLHPFYREALSLDFGTRC